MEIPFEKTVEHYGDKAVIRIEYDDDAMNPREHGCNLGEWIGFEHRHYNIGDRQMSPVEAFEHIAREIVPTFPCFDDVEWSEEEYVKHAKALMDSRCAWHFVTLFDHSGLRFYVGSPTCPWDSGICGIIWMPLAKAIGEWGGDSWDSPYVCDGKTYTLRSFAKRALEAEIDDYDKWQRGEYVGFTVSIDDEVVESVWGYDSEDHCLDEAESMAEYALKRAAEKRFDSVPNLFSRQRAA